MATLYVIQSYYIMILFGFLLLVGVSTQSSSEKGKLFSMGL